jgi:hypothetical protein
MRIFSSSISRICVALTAGVMLALAATFGTQAQTTPPPGAGGMQQQQQPDMQTMRLDLMALQLDLTDQQRTKVKSILDDQDQRRQSVMQKYRKRMKSATDSSARQAMQSKMQSEMQSMQEQTQSRLAEVLDEGQMKSYDTLYGQQSPPSQRGNQQQQQ